MAPLGKRLLQLFVAVHILIYRLSRGRLLNVRDHIVLLTTLGRKSGRLRTAPLFSVRDGAAYIVLGSYGGADIHPAWFHNLQARPRALLTDRGLTLPVTAELADEAEYDRLWAQLSAENPSFEQYRGRTARTLPIVRLRPA